MLSLREEVSDLRILALAHFWSSRCHRKNGEYDNALAHAAEGFPLRYRSRHGANGGRHARGRKLAAVSEGPHQRRSPAAFRSRGGPPRDRRLHHPRQHPVELRPHVPPRRPLRPGAAPFLQRHRRIQPARPRTPQSGALARQYGLCRAPDGAAVAQAHRRRRRPAPQKRTRSAARIREPCGPQALEHLDRATEIYRIHSNHRGAGTVCVNRGHLHLDSGDLQGPTKRRARPTLWARRSTTTY